VDTTAYDTVAVLTVPLAANGDFYWRVNAQNFGGASAYSAARLFSTGTVLSVEAPAAGAPKEFALQQNYPNPFNPSTVISFGVPKTAQVKIVIYDVLGRVVANLVDGIKAPNTYTVTWNASNLSTGVYFYRMTARSVDGSGDFTNVKKLLLMK
jgi:hypothetical protein